MCKTRPSHLVRPSCTLSSLGRATENLINSRGGYCSSDVSGTIMSAATVQSPTVTPTTAVVVEPAPEEEPSRQHVDHGAAGVAPTTLGADTADNAAAAQSGEGSRDRNHANYPIIEIALLVMGCTTAVSMSVVVAVACMG